LLHDLRFLDSELSKAIRSDQPLTVIEKLSSQLHEHLDGYLNSLKAGHAIDTPAIISISKLLKSISSVCHQMTGKNIVYVGDLDVFVWASEPILKRLLLNLIKNGLEAGHGSAPVTVEVTYSEGELALLIKDNGSGFAPDIFESIIDSSSQTALTTKQNGTGLGLRSVLDCAKTIGADVVLLSSDQNGTCFKVILQSNSKTFSSDKAEILVIDDSKTVRDSWETYGATVSTRILAVCPQEAVAILNRKNSNLKWVVLDFDFKLPGCTGADLAEPVKNLGVKVALSSGYQLEELPSNARLIKWDAILSKQPQDPEVAKPVLTSEIGLRLELKKPALTKIRHDLKNVLHPLRTVQRYFNQSEELSGLGTRHVTLFGKSLDQMENIIEQAWKEESL
jgi:anti-sigma regulatory factor (Ser/Thr protein kinase)/CheY-like chemotaxis protein